jgi:hypothetical protein
MPMTITGLVYLLYCEMLSNGRSTGSKSILNSDISGYVEEGNNEARA